MAAKTNISWADSTLQLTGGCRPKGLECTHCYAMQLAWRLAHSPNEAVSNRYTGLVEKIDGRLRWTGEVHLFPEALDEIGSSKLGSVVFIDSLADLFDPKVPFDFLAEAITRMRADTSRVYLLLTKEPRRMREFFGSAELQARFGQSWTPAPNIALGTSIGVQRSVHRAFELAKIPAWYRFISMEPLLEVTHLPDQVAPFIGQLIVGGESGSKASARPMPYEAAITALETAQRWKVNFHFKQQGAWSWLPYVGKTEVSAHGRNYWYVGNEGKKGRFAQLDGMDYHEPLRSQNDPNCIYEES